MKEEEPKKDLFSNPAWTVQQQPEAPVEEEKVPEEDPVQDEEDDALQEVQNYQEVLERTKEQQKIINIQKAKIQALQSELEDALKKNNLQEIQLDDVKNKDQKEKDIEKKF